MMNNLIITHVPYLFCGVEQGWKIFINGKKYPTKPNTYYQKDKFNDLSTVEDAKQLALKLFNSEVPRWSGNFI